MRITFDVNVNLNMARDSEIIDLLKKITNQNTNMAKKIDEINAQLDEINDATNNIAADLDRLAGQTEGGLTPEEAESVTSRLRDSATALRAVANRNPEPTEPTEPEPEA